MPELTGRISTPMSGYATALSTPGASKFYLAAVPAKVGIAMTGLGIVWLVHGATGSYAAAGSVTGGFAVAEALAAPQVARLIDRFGQTRMLPITLVLHGLAIALLLGLAAADSELWLLIIAGVLAGASLPQIGAQTAARWSHALRGSPTLSVAFALESLGTGLAFMVGPALAGVASSLVSPQAGSLVALALVLAGGLSLALQRRTSPPPSKQVHHDRPASLVRPSFLSLTAANVGLGLFFGSMQVSVTAYAVGRGSPELAGPLYSVTSLVALVAGFAYGTRRWRLNPRTQLVVVTTGLSLSCVPLLMVDSVPAMAVALALPGLAIAPYQILSSVIAESEIQPAVLTQAFTWLNSGSAAGIALGAALAGHVVDAHQPRYGFALALTASLVATAMAWLVRRQSRSSTRDSVMLRAA